MKNTVKVLSALALGGTLIIPTLTHASSTRATLPTISVAMNGSSIAVGGALQSGAVTVQVKTTGERQSAPIFIRLKPGMTPQQVYAFLRTGKPHDPNTVSRFGSIVMASEFPAGTNVLQTVLQPATYLAFDTTRNNPARWPTTSFSIAPSAHPAVLPAASATIHIIEFGFRGPATFRAGAMVRVYNNGYLVHMAVLIGARSLKGANQVAALLRAGKDNQAQRFATSFFGLAGPISHDAQQQLRLHAAPGYYVLACFMDTQDGREHSMLGMTRIVQIVP